MKIQRQRTRKNNDYYKYAIVIPKSILKDSGFAEGNELIAEVRRGEIKLIKKK